MLKFFDWNCLKDTQMNQSAFVEVLNLQIHELNNHQIKTELEILFNLNCTSVIQGDILYLSQWKGLTIDMKNKVNGNELIENNKIIISEKSVSSYSGIIQFQTFLKANYYTLHYLRPLRRADAGRGMFKVLGSSSIIKVDFISENNEKLETPKTKKFKINEFVQTERNLSDLKESQPIPKDKKFDLNIENAPILKEESKNFGEKEYLISERSCDFSNFKLKKNKLFDIQATNLLNLYKDLVKPTIIDLKKTNKENLNKTTGSPKQAKLEGKMGNSEKKQGVSFSMNRKIKFREAVGNDILTMLNKERKIFK